jgi:hypothetical protein
MNRFETEYVVVYEDGEKTHIKNGTEEVDAPAKVMIPAPEWMYQALQGGELLPLWAHFKLREELSLEERADILFNTPKLGPLTEEQAIAYLIMKDIPEHVWSDRKSNKPKYRVAKRSQMPATREWRNAWRLAI